MQVVRLMDEVESAFVEHFANNDRKKAMKFLRPQQNKDSHMVTFFVGNFLYLLHIYISLQYKCHAKSTWFKKAIQ